MNLQLVLPVTLHFGIMCIVIVSDLELRRYINSPVYDCVTTITYITLFTISKKNMNLSFILTSATCIILKTIIATWYLLKADLFAFITGLCVAYFFATLPSIKSSNIIFTSGTNEFASMANVFASAANVYKKVLKSKSKDQSESESDSGSESEHKGDVKKLI